MMPVTNTTCWILLTFAVLHFLCTVMSLQRMTWSVCVAGCMTNYTCLCETALFISLLEANNTDMLV